MRDGNAQLTQTTSVLTAPRCGSAFSEDSGLHHASDSRRHFPLDTIGNNSSPRSRGFTVEEGSRGSVLRGTTTASWADPGIFGEKIAEQNKTIAEDIPIREMYRTCTGWRKGASGRRRRRKKRRGRSGRDPRDRLAARSRSRGTGREEPASTRGERDARRRDAPRTDRGRSIGRPAGQLSNAWQTTVDMT